MQTHVMKYSLTKGDALVLSAFLILLFISCSHPAGGEGSNFVSKHDTEDFHADNDIAMTIRSLADAIKVGEPLDSSLYDFEGVLTDGQGTPIYTDVQGAPGVWKINVVDNKNVIIRNLYLGDLLPGDLQTYLLQSLRISDTHPVAISYSANEHSFLGEPERLVYDFGGGYLCFEIRVGIAPNGLEGPLLSIIMTADPPAGVEIQTNGLVQNVAKP